MSNLVKQNEFLDHCHLLPEAQKRLAKVIYDKLSNYNFLGKEKSFFKKYNLLPELFKGL